MNIHHWDQYELGGVNFETYQSEGSYSFLTCGNQNVCPQGCNFKGVTISSR